VTGLIPGRDRDCGAICLAVLQRDGFISLDAGEQEGHVVTKPFEMSDGKLSVNVNAREGELRVEEHPFSLGARLSLC
jgi:hypothetical protein